ncbi:hypothetical protein MtrunA17_Chr7g0241791 [Medicago truncatula]|uniref:DUF247 domain protein n=1 Tax=Medicago truncatula TaxID=3880 RepID=A0A396GZ69_MEDTR|nr:hypothetical protein MtrunA17_Chr7g0241791 [Medicago truncatula]
MNYWCHSVSESLNFDDLSQQSISVSIVPERLKKSKEDAYVPRVVSIGPRFKGSREDLLLMEDIKMRCMKHLFLRTREIKSVDISILLLDCSHHINEMEFSIRGSYVADINQINQTELAKIMLVDSLFLLELLISKGLYDELPCHLNCPSPALEVLRDEDVLSDLTLLENQIPMFNPEWENKINNLVPSVLGYSHDSPVQTTKGINLLDIVHLFVNGKGESTTRVEKEEDHVVLDIIDTTQSRTQLKLNRCALRLLTAGVAIKPNLPKFGGSIFFFIGNILCVNGKHLDLDHISEEVKLEGMDFKFKFEKGELEIEQLHITKTTKAKWCNLIAWEHLQTKARGGSGGCKFTLAALIFNGLICSEDDVQLLKDKKIVVDYVKMSNQELMEFFRAIAFGVDHEVVDSSGYIQMVDDINNYFDTFFLKRIWKIVSSSFTYRHHGWLFRFMNRNYNFVATVLSILTVVQTVYAILAYNFPK